MKRIWSGITKRVLTQRVGAVAMILAMLGILFFQYTPQIRQTARDVFTIGTVEAAGVADATADGVADNIECQALVTALPATGGRLYILTGTYVWANGATVTDASPAITISGTGYGTYITAGDGVTSPFTAGASNWTFRDFRTNVTRAVFLTAMGATTGWSWENVTFSDVYVAYQTDNATTGTAWNIPTGRGATIYAAASNATATEKAQADYVSTGVAGSDDELIEAAIVAANGGDVGLSSGIFSINAAIDITVGAFRLFGTGLGTDIQSTNAMTAYAIVVAPGLNEVWIDNIHMRGAVTTGQATGGGVYAKDILYLHLAHMSIANYPEYGVWVDHAGGGSGSQVYFHAIDNGAGGLGDCGFYLNTCAGHISDMWMEFNTGSAFDLVDCHGLVITNVFSQANGSNLDPVLKISGTTTDSAFSNFSISGAKATAVSVGGASNFNTFSNFVLGNPGRSVTNTYNGFEFIGTSHYNTATNIAVYWDGVVAERPLYCFYEAATAYNNSIIGGSVFGAETANVYSASATPFKIIGLEGYISSFLVKDIVGRLLPVVGDVRLLIPCAEVSGTTVNDYTSKQHAMTASTALQSWVVPPDQVGKVTYYSQQVGDNYTISVADHADFTFNDAGGLGFSVVVLAKMTNTADPRNFISKWNNGGADRREWSFYVDGTELLTLQLYDETADKTPYRVSNAAITLGSWVVFGATYDGGGGATAATGITLYQNGLVIASTATNDGAYVSMQNTASTVVLMSRAAGEWFRGSQSVVIVTAKEMTADEHYAVAQTLLSLVGY